MTKVFHVERNGWRARVRLSQPDLEGPGREERGIGAGARPFPKRRPKKA